ncbi:hypothetical protein [Candidatus Phytoplasma sp. AldY-WA1]|uniref:hypothetical protein n=1 Tax=Candidatus Phytoplasma sp. AldY-WA1 TaxID=2852100 RepID=UPI00254C2910|nr:hypothetical protein [Candidatus Phytoplasma sp. AldY-WA1]
MNKQSLEEIEKSYFDLFLNLFKENKEINDDKIEEKINKLIKQIRYLLFCKVINFKFPFPLEKEDLMLITYQILVEKSEKIRSKIQSFGKRDFINAFVIKSIRNYFYNLSRNQNLNEIGFIDIKNSILTKSNEEVELSNFDLLDNPIIHKKNETKFGDELYRQDCEISLLKNIVNRELTKAELKIFQTAYQLEQFNSLSNEEVAKELNTTKAYIEKEKSIIQDKIKFAKQRRRLVDLLTITKITNKDFLKTLKCCQLKTNQPQITYFSDDENTLYYSEFDKKLVFQLIENKDNQYKLSTLYFDEIDCIEKEKKIK